MRRTLLLGICGAALVAATPFFSSAGEAMQRLAGEVARLTAKGETEQVIPEETEFGRHLLKTWKTAGVELPMPEEQIKRLHKGTKRLATAPEVELPANMRFTGFLQYTNVDGEMHLPYGFYTFSQRDLNRKLYQKLNACINVGGTYVGNRLYGTTTLNILDKFADNLMYFYGWDTDTWSEIIDPKKNVRDVACGGGIDFDPVTGKVFGIDKAMRTTLKTIDFEGRTSEEVADLSASCPGACAFAISNDGVGYAISQEKILCSIDLSTGEVDELGELDFPMYIALQSMTFDRKTGKLYLVASEGDPDGSMYGRLCEVNVEDASTKLIGYLPEAEEYTVLHVVYDPEADAPGAITDLTATYADANLGGTLTFTVPETTFGGSTLTGNVDYKVYINDEETPAVTGTANAGEKVSADVTATEGRTKYVVVLSNEAGEGERQAIESWGGEDTPAVRAAEAVADGDNVTVTWEAGGANGGYADFDGITYTLYRFPGPKVVAEGLTGNSFTDDIAEAPNGMFNYNVVPVKGDRYYQGFKTGYVYGGAARELPYSQDFESSKSVYDFLMLNNHEAGWEIAYQWDLEGVMWYTSSPYTDSDSWALSPALEFEEGSTYIIDFNMSKVSTRFDEYLGVGVGMGTDPSTYDTIMEKTMINERPYNGGQAVHLVYECKESGAYHVGFHAMSPRNQSGVFIHKMSVEKGLSTKVPAAATDITAEPGAHGDLTATIRFTAPETTVGGVALDKIDRLTLYREGTEEPIAEITGATPGQKYELVDEDAMNGRVNYTVTAWNEFGEGASASTSVYVGYDTPVAPYNVTVKDNLDGTVTLTWEQSETGVNGGVVDLDDVTYNVYYYSDGSNVLLEGDVEGTTYTVKGLRTTGAQTFMFLMVSAVNDLGESKLADAPAVNLGDPYTVPFMEGFLDLAGIWLPEGDGSVSWSLYSGSSSDGDNYLMGAKAKDDIAYGSLRSGKFSLKGVEDPKLAFSFYGMPGTDNSIIVSVVREGNSTEDILTIPFMTMEGDYGWRTCIADLSRYKDDAYINLVFNADIKDYDNYVIYFDDVNVRNVPEHNMALTVAPQNRVTAGENERIDVMIHNVGMNIENGYKVEIYVDDVLETTLNAKEVYPFDRVNMSYSHHVPAVSAESCKVTAKLVDANDAMTEDNASEGSYKVAAPLLEAATGLTGTQSEGQVILSWEAPANSSTVTDSFEGYESFLYDGFGDWKVIDGDGNKTFPVVSAAYPGRGQASAFFTVDFTSLGYDKDVVGDYLGNTGESYIACIVPNTLTSDDWVISPELSGEAQTISLFARSVGSVYGDTFEILYSEGGTEVSDFTAYPYEYEPGDEWEMFIAELPAGAKRFAIHCKSFYGGMLMIDDVTYEAAARELTGYNIYRDGELVATVGADTLTYSEADNGEKASYEVTAVYNAGESAPCEKVSLTSVAMIGSLGVSVSATDGMITIAGAEGHEVSVIAADGKVIFSGKANGTVNIPAAQGVYAVKVDKASAKILVY